MERRAADRPVGPSAASDDTQDFFSLGGNRDDHAQNSFDWSLLVSGHFADFNSAMCATIGGKFHHPVVMSGAR